VSVDTEIKGEPGQVEGVADWLRNQLAAKLDQAVDRLNDARRDAEGSWNCDAGDDFAGTMTRARDETEDLHKAARTMAGDLDDFATKLRRCQDEMADVRREASGAGLAVSGFIVQDPGPGPARPPDDFVGTPQEVAQHNQRVDAYDAHQRLIEAFNDAAREAARIDRQYGAACRALQKEYTLGQHAAWVVTVNQVLGKSAPGIEEFLHHKASKLHDQARDLINDAQRAIDDLQANPERYMKRKWGFLRTLDETKLEADRLAISGKLDEATSLMDEASKLDDTPSLKYLGRAGKVLGPLGVAVGVYNDYQEGETTTQIAVSQGMSTAVGTAAGAGAGYLATIGTAAATGAAFGSVVPGAGTVVGGAVGTLVGVGVAIFADGAIDSLFDNGPDVGKAWDEGVDALQETGGAIAEGVSNVGDTVGGWFS
jgi:uncharacterized protein YukE